MTSNAEIEGTLRGSLQNSSRVVVKLGTRVIAGAEANSLAGAPDRQRLSAIVAELAELRAEGKEVVLVTSGAIGAGLEALNLAQRPTELADLQMCASVGQVRLMSFYDELFAAHQLSVAQVLLTRDGLVDEKRLSNMKNTIEALLKKGVVPVVNENDAVSVAELAFGDNDCLAAMLSAAIQADSLLLLTTTNGLMDLSGSEPKRVSFLPQIGARTFSFVEDEDDSLSTGGMKSKLEAAKLASSAGIVTVIADGREDQVISRLFAGESLGSIVDKS